MMTKTIDQAMKAMDEIEREIVAMEEGQDKSIAAAAFLDLAVILAKVKAQMNQ
jgi:hypothetical protein